MMSFKFEGPKSTLPSSTMAGGDSGASQAQPGAQTKPLTLFGTTTTTTTVPTFSLGTVSTAATTTSGTGFTFSAPAVSSAPQFNLGSALSTAPATSTTYGFGGAATTTAPSTSFGLGTSLGTTPATTTTAPLTFGSLGSSTATTTPLPFTFSLSGLTITTTTATSTLSTTGTLTFAQLEDAINKWTIELEEQGKVFANQAQHLNAWDRLLMSNGEKILSVSNGVERIKQQQKQLDQELDFVLAQQKELEDCIIPLEKEYQDVPVTDMDRDQTYKLAENIDAQLKQMSEDLKEIIEHVNESNKVQELSDPVTQIGRILNAHMNSLQWIDSNTTLISAHLDEIAKMHDTNRKNHENLYGA